MAVPQPCLPAVAVLFWNYNVGMTHPTLPLTGNILPSK